VILTGQLGEVMKESVSTALSWIKSNYKRLNLRSSPIFLELGESQTAFKKVSENKDDLLDRIDIHVHFPSAAIPKDGPSAGITICTALVSLLLERKVYSNLAMTGEISLIGRVHPVGGIKEKVIAASLLGLKRVILPEENRLDFEKMENLSDIQLRYPFVTKCGLRQEHLGGARPGP
jgi:ATP-dependent Lon protease